jgi:hypothetical protein
VQPRHARGETVFWTAGKAEAGLETGRGSLSRSFGFGVCSSVGSAHPGSDFCIYYYKDVQFSISFIIVLVKFNNFEV